MSLQQRHSLNPPSPTNTNTTTTTQTPPPTANDIKNRVITCLNKLNDRDTFTLATTELNTIITKALTTPQTLSTFIACIHSTDLSSSKSPVRKHCVTLLTILSVFHGPSLSPHLPKLLSALLRLLRDHHHDSAVRTTCVSAASAISANVPTPDPFSTLFNPMLDMVTLEQEVNVQTGAAMCLAAAIEALPEQKRAEVVVVEKLRKVLLPRMGKLVKGDGFKAKAAVLGVMGSVVGAGGASARVVLDGLVKCFVEFLSCDDWVVRKAAAEALGKVALKEKDLAMEHKVYCFNALQNRRFDKVKVVRETLNRTLDLWKEVPGVDEDVPTPSPSRSSSDTRCFSSSTKTSRDIGFKTPQPTKTVSANRSPPSDISCVTTAKTQSPAKNGKYSNTSISSKLDHKEPSNVKVEILVSQQTSCGADIKIRDSGEDKKKYGDVLNDKVHKFGGFRSGSRVVPVLDDEKLPDKDVRIIHPPEDLFENHKDIEVEDLSLIRDQLLQIENQQSNLFNLLQRYIGSSQKGINSLQTRVHGLEMALNEISYDLAVSSGRVPEMDFGENQCCKLPGAEFLSPKFWKRTEGRYSSPTFSSCGSIQPPSPFSVRNVQDSESTTERYRPDGQRLQLQSRIGFYRNPTADVHYQMMGTSGFRGDVLFRNGRA